MSEFEYDEKSSENEKESSGESNNADGYFLLYEHDSKIISLHWLFFKHRLNNLNLNIILIV